MRQPIRVHGPFEEPLAPGKVWWRAEYHGTLATGGTRAEAEARIRTTIARSRTPTYAQGPTTWAWRKAMAERYAMKVPVLYFPGGALP